jgi:hypothetical protein
VCLEKEKKNSNKYLDKKVSEFLTQFGIKNF